MKMLIFSSHYAPYKDGYFQYIQDVHDVDISLYLFKREASTHTEWEYEHPSFNEKYLGKAIFTRHPFLTYRKGMLHAIRTENYDVCFSPYWYVYFLVRLFNKKASVIYTADTISDRQNSKLYKKLISFMYKKFDAIFCPGEAAKRYYQSYGVDLNKVFLGFYTNDAEKILKKIETTDKNAVKKELNINPDDFVFLFIGKLIHNRKIDNLLKVFETIKEPRVKVIVIGDGPEQELVEKYLEKKQNVIYIPRVKLDDIEKYYAVADAYIHPGSEPYSLAVYEAAIAGIPIVCSCNVGAVYDCVQDGKNGYIVLEDDLGKLEESIMRIVEDPSYYRPYCYDIKNRIQSDRGIKWAGENLYSAIMYSRSKRSKK